ncbi:DUF397 domain-containing protein [Actinomadura harenae]|uniref:DUF397 domain-containing protein n=1 Tax=Actinomadura harenae TaxID=2483351 RepID=A0A3M2M0T8_9ACTN|nr:DUF397 domain-containing protein [Actinomadura harenae]RMI43042.1 DUF397 domain-containing protein [Actinomadura harenae]
MYGSIRRWFERDHRPVFGAVLVTVVWRKSSYSGGADDEQCIELGRLASSIGLRDSKSPASGHLSLSEVEFGGLVESIKRAQGLSG